jgi:hypothetical protein
MPALTGVENILFSTWNCKWKSALRLQHFHSELPVTGTTRYITDSSHHHSGCHRSLSASHCTLDTAHGLLRSPHGTAHRSHCIQSVNLAQTNSKLNSAQVAMTFDNSATIKQGNKQPPWYESVSKLYRPSDRRLLAKLVPTLVGRGCRVVSAMDPHGRIFGSRPEPLLFLPSSSSMVLRGCVDPVPDPLLLRKSGSARNLTRNHWIYNLELWPLDHRGWGQMECTGTFMKKQLRGAQWLKKLPTLHGSYKPAELNPLTWLTAHHTHGCLYSLYGEWRWQPWNM